MATSRNNLQCGAISCSGQACTSRLFDWSTVLQMKLSPFLGQNSWEGGGCSMGATSIRAEQGVKQVSLVVLRELFHFASFLCSTNTRVDLSRDVSSINTIYARAWVFMGDAGVDLRQLGHLQYLDLKWSQSSDGNPLVPLSPISLLPSRLGRYLPPFCPSLKLLMVGLASVRVDTVLPQAKEY